MYLPSELIPTREFNEFGYLGKLHVTEKCKCILLFEMC